MSQANARLLRMGVAAAATGAMVLTTVTAAGVSASAAAPGITTIDTTVTVDGGFTLPASVQSGLVTFRMTGGDETSHAVQGFRVRPGSTLEEVMHDFDVTLLSSEFPDRAAGARALSEHAVLIGGVVTAPERAISVTVPLEAGTYYFFDLDDLGTREVRLHTMQATGRFRVATPPRFTSVILTKMSHHEPRFITPTSLSARESFLFVNNGDEIHEVVFRRTRPGITDEYITEFYDAVLAGGPRPESPWLDVQHGLQSLSPGRWAITQIDLPPGDYSEICYVPDDEIGIPHAYEGMHKQVVLH